MVRQAGGDPNAEAGYVGSNWNSTTGELVGISSVIELRGSDVCGALETFAAATIKPTKCLVSAPFVPASIRRVRVRRTILVGGKLQTRMVWVLQRVPSAHPKQAQQFGPCYLGAGKRTIQMPSSFWSDYDRYVGAIVTLAHESIHAGGVVGGLIPNGLAVGDPQAEAKAECYGMQWIPFVAERLGDSPDDAQAIATYFWDVIYPRARTAGNSTYWSADCRPFGALDLHLPGGASAWP